MPRYASCQDLHSVSYVTPPERTAPTDPGSVAGTTDARTERQPRTLAGIRTDGIVSSPEHAEPSNPLHTPCSDRPHHQSYWWASAVGTSWCPLCDQTICSQHKHYRMNAWLRKMQNCEPGHIEKVLTHGYATCNVCVVRPARNLVTVVPGWEVAGDGLRAYGLRRRERFAGVGPGRRDPLVRMARTGTPVRPIATRVGVATGREPGDARTRSAGETGDRVTRVATHFPSVLLIPCDPGHVTYDTVTQSYASCRV